MNPEQYEQIATKIHELMRKEKNLTYYEALGILEVVKAYYVTRICQLNKTPGTEVFKVKP